jgi:DNA recombination protein RmuC
MDIIFILVGIVVGTAVSYIIFSLKNKANNISKAEYENLSSKFNEANLQMQLKISSLEITIKNDEQKVAELSESLSEQTKQNETKQAEINSLKQELSEKNATNKSVSNNLVSQKELYMKQTEEVKLLNERLTKMLSENSILSAKNSSLEESCNLLKETNQKHTEQIKLLTDQYNKINAENSRLTANNKALDEKLSTQKEEITAMQKTAHLQFEKIATQILEEKSGKFTEVNKANIEAILKPLGENIDSFKKKVEETYDKESKERFSLGEKVKDLVEQTNKVSSEANNLATALKGQAKKQGNWGEMILESILQQSGLEKNREYFLQETIKDEEGKSLRPDVLVKLPDNRIIIIDSKVSLVAYDRFSSADTVDEQAVHLNEHLKSIYAHVDELSNKKYDNLESSLDFTMMFVPIEPAYLLVIQNDQDLWADAYSKRILLISPTNLIACLKLMADLWKREIQSKNAQNIVKRGELMYEKFVSFVEMMEDVGKYIDKTQQSYTTAINQLKNGRGNLVGQALTMKNLGLKSSKTISTNMLPTDLETEQIDEIKKLPN